MYGKKRVGMLQVAKLQVHRKKREVTRRWPCLFLFQSTCNMEHATCNSLSIVRRAPTSRGLETRTPGAWRVGATWVSRPEVADSRTRSGGGACRRSTCACGLRWCGGCGSPRGFRAPGLWQFGMWAGGPVQRPLGFVYPRRAQGGVRQAASSRHIICEYVTESFSPRLTQRLPPAGHDG